MAFLDTSDGNVRFTRFGLFVLVEKEFSIKLMNSFNNGALRHLKTSSAGLSGKNAAK